MEGCGCSFPRLFIWGQNAWQWDSPCSLSQAPRTLCQVSRGCLRKLNWQGPRRHGGPAAAPKPSSEQPGCPRSCHLPEFRWACGCPAVEPGSEREQSALGAGEPGPGAATAFATSDVRGRRAHQPRGGFLTCPQRLIPQDAQVVTPKGLPGSEREQSALGAGEPGPGAATAFATSDVRGRRAHQPRGGFLTCPQRLIPQDAQVVTPKGLPGSEREQSALGAGEPGPGAATAFATSDVRGRRAHQPRGGFLTCPQRLIPQDAQVVTPKGLPGSEREQSALGAGEPGPGAATAFATSDVRGRRAHQPRGGFLTCPQRLIPQDAQVVTPKGLPGSEREQSALGAGEPGPGAATAFATSDVRGRRAHQPRGGFLTCPQRLIPQDAQVVTPKGLGFCC
ncbi:collagen alpha-1(I) chain isoform X2 [Delphinus delphis]|uniref:collagen alpha-1(I) chain isoform X2 n=1 Tax=Delphinus delphis TaxID=9728 RepID=UPI0028C4E488|nr:collagen alpha-1(I) chain isoform X2 [Delphinus delphis]